MKRSGLTLAVLLAAAVAVAILASAGCGESAPDSPTWIQDVRPILVANCVRCHSPPQIGGAPSYFRLDVYEDTDLDTFASTCDAGAPCELGAASESLLASGDVITERMPPRFPLTDRQKQVIQNWADDGAPKGPPRADNHVPTMELTGEPSTSGDHLLVPYLIQDRDFDIVTGYVTAEPTTGGPALTLPRELYVGASEIVIPATTPPGTYDLTATLDDGSDTVAVDLGTIEVAP